MLFGGVDLGGSTLAQVMAWCSQATSRYLDQCWLAINEVQWYLSEGKFKKDTPAIHSTKISLKITIAINLKFSSDIYLRANSQNITPTPIIKISLKITNLIQIAQEPMS